MTTQRNLTGAGLAGGAATAILGVSASALTATGTTQATAYFISADINVFSTVASSAGAVLTVGAIGDTYMAINNGANNLSVYPPVPPASNHLAKVFLVPV